MPIIIIGMVLAAMKPEKKVEAQPYLEKSAARKVIDAFKYLGSYIMICTASKMQWTTTSNTSNGWKRKNDQPKQLNPN